MMTKIKNFSNYAKNHMLTLGTLLAVAWSVFFMLVGFSWLLGFWLNGLFGFKFELASCWQGLTMVIGAIPSLYTLSKSGLGKYRVDSELNSKLGERPTHNEGGI